MSNEKRLSKAMAAAGIASRRACEKLIFAGLVKVNGKTALLPQTMVDWERDSIIVDGKAVKGEEIKKYYMLNKPCGYVCSNKQGNSTKIVSNLFKDEGSRLFTVGRLDKETSGLIIVTNDGHFANKVIHPSNGVEKEYLAKTNKEITAEHLKLISGGAIVEGAFVQPKSVTKVRKGTLKVVVSDGKKHEVRILLENAGLEVRELSRIRIGGLHLSSLARGQWKAMTIQEQELVTGCA
ncbi:MAG: 23S rRNA pseudouridine2605 synthase [Chlamydiales bacterium]|jgi:23S rRNA pseudouridine2605 synthase